MGPKEAKVGKEVQLTVTDGATGTPVEGADVGGHLTDKEGHVNLKFNTPRIYKFKATFPMSVRSNALEIHVKY